MTQTAVEWLVSQLEKTGFASNNLVEFYNDIEIAKEIEAKQMKEQRLEGYKEGIDSASTYYSD